MQLGLVLERKARGCEGVKLERGVGGDGQGCGREVGEKDHCTDGSFGEDLLKGVKLLVMHVCFDDVMMIL